MIFADRPVSDDMAADAQQWLQQAHSELGNMDVRLKFLTFTLLILCLVAYH